MCEIDWFMCEIDWFMCEIDWFMCEIDWFMCEIDWFMCEIDWFMCEIDWFMCEIDWFMCEIDWFMCDISGIYGENKAINYLREISEFRRRSYRASAKCVCLTLNLGRYRVYRVFFKVCLCTRT